MPIIICKILFCLLFIPLVNNFIHNSLRRTRNIGKTVGKFFRSLVLPYSSSDEPGGVKTLAYSIHSVELKDVLTADTFGSSESLKNAVVEAKLCGKYGGLLKVIPMLSYYVIMC